MVDSVQLAELKARRLLYLNAEAKVLQGQSYAIGNRSLTRAQLSEIRKELKDIEAKIYNLEYGGIQVNPVNPMDLI